MKQGENQQKSLFSKEPAPILQGSALAEAHGATFNWPPVIKDSPESHRESAGASKLQRPSFAFDLLQYNSKTYTWV